MTVHYLFCKYLQFVYNFRTNLQIVYIFGMVVGQFFVRRAICPELADREQVERIESESSTLTECDREETEGGIMSPKEDGHTYYGHTKAALSGDRQDPKAR